MPVYVDISTISSDVVTMSLNLRDVRNTVYLKLYWKVFHARIQKTFVRWGPSQKTLRFLGAFCFCFS